MTPVSIRLYIATQENGYSSNTLRARASLNENCTPIAS